MIATITVHGVERRVFGSESDGYYQTWARAGTYGAAHELVPFERCVRTDSVCLDVGANLGLTALLMCCLAPRGHVFAFEPEPDNFGYLSQTLRANAVDNCTAVQVALGRRRGEGRGVVKSLAGRGQGTLRLRAAGPNSHVDLLEDAASPTVPVVALDRWAAKQRLQRLDVIKIDVEGYEQAVLAGARRTIRRFRPCAIIEFNSLTAITVGRILPFTLLDAIMEQFPKVAVVDRDSGEPRLLGRSPAEREAFVAGNLMGGFLDDLVCYFDDAQLS